MVIDPIMRSSEDWCGTRSGTDIVWFRKPETRFYAYCLERNKIAAHEAVFLDDLGQYVDGPNAEP